MTAFRGNESLLDFEALAPTGSETSRQGSPSKDVLFANPSMLRRLTLLVLLVCPLSALAQSRLFTEAAPNVRWEKWSDATLARAKKENKPLFVSSGYVSANAWHLLHHDALTLPEIVQTLNAEYVPVLVDQQLQPELAGALETILRATTGAGTSPVNVVLTPDLEPIAAAGYLKAGEMKALLFGAIQRWNSARDALRAEARTALAKAREAAARNTAAPPIDENALGPIVESIARTWDSKRGGFGREPKLLQPLTVSFLFAYAQQKRRGDLRDITIDMLRKISSTPAHDQLGGGFHRGSVTADWSLPIFEKMLYDQALMALVLLDAWKFTRDERLANMSRATIVYALRDLREIDGSAFWSAQDAYNYIPGFGKPELANGMFYTWSVEEIRRIFGAKADLVFRLYGMSEGGNAARGVDPALTGKNLLWMQDPEILRQHNAEVVPVLEKILKWRQGRPAPFRDDKVLAGWNGLMISALARVGAALGEEAYVSAATKAANAVTTSLWNGKTKTLSRAKGYAATPEDYALLVQGLLDVYEATYDVRWYELATTLQARQDALFWDEKLGRYAGGGTLPAALRGLDVEDDVDTPGANGVAAMNLMRIAALSGQPAWQERAAMIFRAFASRLAAEGASLPQVASAFAASLATPKQIVVIPGQSSEKTAALLRTAHDAYIPVRAIVRLPQKGPARERVLATHPWARDLQSDPEQGAVYVCASGRCERSTPEPAALAKFFE